MNLLQEEMNLFEDIMKESGLYNIKNLKEFYKYAIIYYHQDFDGITSAIAMREYLKRQGYKVLSTRTIQYNSKEFTQNTIENELEELNITNINPEEVLRVLVDFTQGKYWVDIHTDHHSSQTGTEEEKSTHFSHDRSQAQTISNTISPSLIWNQKEAEIIGIVDSADFAKYDLTPEKIATTNFNHLNIKSDEDKILFGVFMNNWLMANKNRKTKDGQMFIDELTMTANSSFISLYTTTKKLIDKYGLKSVETFQQANSEYMDAQAEKSKKIYLDEVPELSEIKSGNNYLIDNMIYQFGGGWMRYGYYRYTQFKTFPEAEFNCIIWDMGLIQVSKNPFQKKENKHNLRTLVIDGVMQNYKDYFSSKEVSLYTIKKTNEEVKKDKQTGEYYSKEGTEGFTYYDYKAMFGELDDEKIIEALNTPFNDLTKDNKRALYNYTIPIWDIIMKRSGGHDYGIINVSGLGYLKNWMFTQKYKSLRNADALEKKQANKEVFQEYNNKLKEIGLEIVKTFIDKNIKLGE
jgi:hypothetical protein